MRLGSPISRGNTAKIYHTDGKVIKLFDDRLPEGEAEYEASKQRVAYLCGLPVPKVFDVTYINGRQAIVMEYINGTTLGDLMKRNVRKAEIYLSLSVDVQIEMHSKSITELEPMEDKLTRQIQSADILEPAERTCLLKRLGFMPSVNMLCHGDFHVFNLIKSDNRIFVIDWVDSSIGNPCADVYRTYLLYSQISTDLAAAYLQLYCEKGGINQADIFKWAPIIAAARLSENVPSERADRLLKIIHQYS